MYCVAAVVILFGFGIYYEMYGKKKKAFDQRWTFLNSKGMSHFIEHDFTHGSRLFNGKLIAGGKCMMGENTGLIVLYKEISLIYRKCHTLIFESGSQSSFGSIVIAAGGREYEICKLKSFEEQSRDWYDLCAFLVNAAPNIAIDPVTKHTSAFVESDDDSPIADGPD